VLHNLTMIKVEVLKYNSTTGSGKNIFPQCGMDKT
jgi:hypothetical protein